MPLGSCGDSLAFNRFGYMFSILPANFRCQRPRKSSLFKRSVSPWASRKLLMRAINELTGKLQPQIFILTLAGNG